MGRAQNPFPLGPIFGFEQDIAGRLVASALLPNLGGLKSRHEDFQRTGSIHLFADDLADFLQGFQAHGQESIKASRQLPDQAGSQQQLMRSNFSLGRCFFQGGGKGL